MTSYCTIKSKLSGNVIDIQGASTKPGALLNAFPPKATGNDNQLWEFVADPAASGYYFIKSKLSGNVIDIQKASTKPGALLDAFPQKTTGADNQLWTLIQDPAAAGYYFIRSKLSHNVIDIQGASTKAGALLDAFPPKTSGNDNQLWTAEGGAFPAPVYTGISWGPEGTGPAPNSSTVGSGGNKCAYQVSLSIQQDGSCTFSGYYQNRGDVFAITAPPQAFAVAFVVLDTSGRPYLFAHSGEIPSAPQTGSLVTWNLTLKLPAIADNWYPIAARNLGYAFYRNSYDLSFGSVIGQLLGDVASAFGTLVSDIVQALAGETGPVGVEEAIVEAPRPALPAGAPTGAAAAAHAAVGPLTGKGT